MGDIFGSLFSVTTFGESHGEAVGVVISGVPAGVSIKEADIQRELDRRKPGQSKISTSRRETDSLRILSGVFDGKTTGTALAMMVLNQDMRSSSYKAFSHLYRPSHADFTYDIKYGRRDWRGGGRASARETIARVCAGAVAQKILSSYYDITVNSWVSEIYNIRMPESEKSWQRREIESSPVRCPHRETARQMEEEILEIKKRGDSIGGIISCRISNVPAGLGEPVFDRMEADLAKAMLSIPATKGFEIGSGFQGITMTGKEHNDIFIAKKKTPPEKNIGTLSNNSGGVQGGITNGEDIFFRVAFKPTATIFSEQETVDTGGKKAMIKAKGRHDPCVVPRAVPIVDSMAALVVMDKVLSHESYHRFHPGISMNRIKNKK